MMVTIVPDAKLPFDLRVMDGGRCVAKVYGIDARPDTETAESIARTLSISLDQEGLVERVAMAIRLARFNPDLWTAEEKAEMCKRPLARIELKIARAAILALREGVEEVPYCGIVVVPEGD